MSKTLNEGCADLQQYPASKVCQLAKKLESSKATAHHIKQATSNALAAQINLLCHQHTELSQKKRTTLLALDLIQTRPQLDYLPSRTKLITSAADHPALTKKTAHQAKATTEQSKPLHKKSVKMHKNSVNMHKNHVKCTKTA